MGRLVEIAKAALAETEGPSVGRAGVQVGADAGRGHRCYRRNHAAARERISPSESARGR